MSSMRNAVQRRNHKERAQPLEREKWGILEKHKDYSLRAKDHNEKKKRIKILRQKAADRNPDEFAFGMMSSTTSKGVRVTERQKENGQMGALGVDAVKLLKTQDAGYLQTMLQQTKRERGRVEQQLTLANAGVDTSKTSKKIVFNEEGKAVGDAMPEMEDDEDDDMFSDEEAESSDDDAAEQGLTKEQIKLRRRRRHNLKVLEGRLEGLRAREASLKTTLDHLDKQRAKMNNTIGGTNKNGVRFKLRERKR